MRAFDIFSLNMQGDKPAQYGSTLLVYLIAAQAVFEVAAAIGKLAEAVKTDD